MIVTNTQVRKLPGMSMTGLGVEQDPNNLLGVIVRAGQIVLANSVVLTLPTDTPVYYTLIPALRSVLLFPLLN